MKKSLNTKLFYAILLSMIFFTIIPHTIKAKSSENLELEQSNYFSEEILEYDNKIMCYDAITNETTEVNMEELKQTLGVQGTENLNSLTIFLKYSNCLL